MFQPQRSSLGTKPVPNEDLHGQNAVLLQLLHMHMFAMCMLNNYYC